MRVETGHQGRDMPFERERRVVLQRLPVGASVTRAVITVTPYAADPERRFLETISFGGASGDWGATKSTASGSLEVDLHARRKLAGVTGTGLGARPLLVDLGGGFMAVNADGGLAEGPPFELADSAHLPALTVTGLRVPGTATAGPDLSALRVSSPPSNVTIAVEGGPTFWTHFGDLVAPQTTPDFSAVLRALLPDLDVVHGHHVVPFVVHSDSICRLDLRVEIEHTISASATPEGIESIKTPYSFNGTPDATSGLLSVRVPAGLMATDAGTTGRAQGSFEASRVVHGSVASVVTEEQPTVSGAAPLAQPLVVPASVVATSVDLLLTAVTAQVTLSVDVMDDLDGKPGRTSLLARPADLTLTRDQAPDATWVNIALPGELESDGRRRWVVLHAREGVATWGALVATAPDQPGLQQTRDGGLSWRVVPGVTTTEALEGQLRLRHSTRTFHMPLELRVGVGQQEIGVPLDRFAAGGDVDLDFGAIGVADAVNTALSAARAPRAQGEHVANGDFTEWFRVGSELAPAGSLRPAPVGTVQPTVSRATFSPTGDAVYAVGTVAGEGELRVEEIYAFAFEPLSRTQLYARRIHAGEPGPLLLDRTGEVAATAVYRAQFESGAGPGGEIALFDTQTGDRIGGVVTTPESAIAMALTADASALLTLGADQDGGAVVRRIGWRELLQAARGGPVLDPEQQASVRVTGTPTALAVARDGGVYVVTVTESGSHLFPLDADLSGPAGAGVETVAEARDVAISVGDDEVMVLGEHALAVLRRSDLRASELALPETEPARSLAVDPVGTSVIVLRDDVLDVFDGRRRRFHRQPDLQPYGRSFATFSPTGTHVVLTDTSGRDVMLLRVGSAVPAEWELTDGRVRPAWLGGPSGTVAVLGEVSVGRSERKRTDSGFGPGALSQVAPVIGGQRYRFSFDGAALGEGAVAELVWRGGGCTTTRTDRVPVQELDPDRTERLDRLPHHELTVTAPADVDQVEVRLRVSEGLMAVDRVSLAGSDERLDDLAAVSTAGTLASWRPEPGLIVTPAASGVTVRNGGGVPAAVAQEVPVAPGERFELTVTARSSETAVVELAFRDDEASPVGEVVGLELDPLQFDQRAAAGDVPATATAAEVRVVVPAAGTVEVAVLSLVATAVQDVQIEFLSEAPGDLTIRGVAVSLEQAPTSVAPLPAGGLCPPTPSTADGEEVCYCTKCGVQRPVQRTVPVVTDAGRPGAVARCPTCSTPRVRMGGRLRRSAAPVPVPRFRVESPAAARSAARPRELAPLRVEASVVEVRGIGDARAAELRTIGIPNVVALATADVDRVAALPGVSDAMARLFIAEAGRLVRERGVRVLLDVY
jgi:hypothetical protein